jgi:hypothetical protein
LTCKVGGAVHRKHNTLVRLLARLLRAAGYDVLEEVWEPRWDKEVRNRDGTPKLDREGNPVWRRARLDLKLMAPPEEPLVFGDVVVSHPGAQCAVRDAANEDGVTAQKAKERKMARYPPAEIPNSRLVAFSVETGGRWDKDALDFLKKAAGRAAQRHPGLASLEEGGSSAVFASWLRQLSCALQKANVAGLRGAAAGGVQPTGVRREEETDPDWLSEQIDELLRAAAEAAGAVL